MTETRSGSWDLTTTPGIWRGMNETPQLRMMSNKEQYRGE
jgi:hypothetical protein